jgi:type VI secretion system secreted protein VgrG
LERANDFLRLVQPENALSTANRQVRLRLGHSDQFADDVLLPQRVRGTESICGGIEYRVACLASSPTLPLKELIALPAEIKFVTDRGQLRSVCGIVTEARAGDYDGGLAAYHLVVRDALAMMEKRTNSRIFRYQNELEIVQILFDEWRHSNAVLASAFDYELHPLFDMRQFPPREETMQHNETDAGFVRRLLKRRGVSWYVRPGRRLHSGIDPAHDRAPAHTLVLFNDAAISLPENAAGIVRYHREDATDERDTITSWTAARTLQPGSTMRHSWDYKNPLGVQFMTARASGRADQGSHGNQLAASLDDYLVEIPHAGNDVEDHWRLGQLRMNRHSFEAKCFHGEGSVRDFCAGEYFTLSGHPEIDTHPAAEREFIITELEVTARNNLPGDLTARAERLFAHDCAEVHRPGLVQISFTAVRRGVPIVPAFDPRVDLPHPQLQSAIVVGPPNEEVHCDALGRVKIRFPGMRAADHKHAHGAGASDGPGDSAWVRVASTWAGNGPGSQQQCGALSLPRVGSEVLVAFMGGDPDRPVILSQLFNQRGEPPALSKHGGLPGNRHLSGTRSREIGGQRGNQLRFDDTRGGISAQLASDHATSQLNLGWLTHPKADGSGEPRGEGAELRSDCTLAIRGGQGVLVSAEPAPEAEGAQLGCAGLIGLAEVMQSVVDELARLARQHAGDEETTRLADLADKLKRWDAGSNGAAGAAAGGAPIVAMTAPAGIVLASADNLALGSEKKVNVVSAGDIEVSAGRNIFLRAARGISAFAHGLGIKLVAGRGNVAMQAHHGNIEIKSSGRISLISAQGIELQAPEVRVVARGAQTDWSKGSITQQCNGQHVSKAAESVQVGPGGGNPATLNFPSTKMRTDERVVLRHQQTGEPVRNQRYKAHLDNGSTIEGVTDDKGRTSLAVSDAMGNVDFDFLPNEPSH